jgi:aspartate 1-decarboxylase
MVGDLLIIAAYASYGEEELRTYRPRSCSWMSTIVRSRTRSTDEAAAKR